MIGDGALSHKKDYVSRFYEVLNFKGHPTRITGSRVKAILLNKLILPIAQCSVEPCGQSNIETQ